MWPSPQGGFASNPWVSRHYHPADDAARKIN
jgi:hypothetical protein